MVHESILIKMVGAKDECVRNQRIDVRAHRTGSCGKAIEFDVNVTP